MDGWMNKKAVLRIAHTNQQIHHLQTLDNIEPTIEHWNSLRVKNHWIGVHQILSVATD